MGFNNFTGTPPNNNGTGNNNTGGNGQLPPGIIMQQQAGSSSMDPLELLIDYNMQFATAGKVLFRDSIIQQSLGAMLGKNKPNILLVGPAGVGKTKIAEDIAFRLSSDDPLIPDALKGYTIYELPLANIVSGSNYVGQVEEKIKAVIDFAEDPKMKVILFIDEIHQLVNESSNSAYTKIAQVLKPALARGLIHVIGATTTQEAKDLADDPAFNRRFTKIIVDELTQDQTTEILFNSKAGLINHYHNKIQINDDTLKTVTLLADEYRPAGSHRPDNALTLLDRAIGDAIVTRKVQEIKAHESGDQTLIQALQAITIIPITERQIKTTAIRLATGNSKPEEVNYDSLSDDLSRIKGQNDILEKLTRILREHECPLYHFDATDGTKNKPETLLFIGPSGVGKTEVTKIISKYVSGTKPIILNMTEFKASNSINRIIGAPAGYVGYDSHSELPFDTLSTNPYQVILLDEFEKCHPSVQTLFMQAFDEGYITTSRGDVIDFSKSIIIATTNAGHTAKAKPLGFSAILGSDEPEEIKTDIDELGKWFDIALLNRFNHQLTFHEIGEDVYREILQNTYKRDVERILTTHPRTQLLPEIPDEDLDKLVKDTYVPEFGARPAAATIKKYVLNQVL